MKTRIYLFLLILLHIYIGNTTFAQEYADSTKLNRIFNNKIAEPQSNFVGTEKSGFLQVEKIQALFHGSLSTRYLPGDIPRLLPTITSPLAFMNTGFGTMIFVDNVLLGFHVGVLRRWNISESDNLSARLYDASYLVDASLGYTIWKQEQLLFTPSATIGVARYVFDKDLAEYTSRYIGAEMNITYTLPITALQYKVPQPLNPQIKNSEFSGTLDAIVSLRIGYANHFAAGFAHSTFSELYARLSVGIGFSRFENP